MKTRRFAAGIAIVVMGLALGAGLALAQKLTAEALFREALLKERAEGSLPEAIFRYERLIAEFPKDRQYAARAMYQLALIYEKQGDPRAKTMLTRLSREYAGVEPFSSRARARLAQQASAPAGPFPEVSLDTNYELGSPDGKFVVYHREPEQKEGQVRRPGRDWGRLYLKELATGKERLLVDHPGKFVSNFAWSPDSRQLAFNFLDDSVKANDIRIVEVSTGEVTSLGLRGYPMAWTEAGEICFYRPNYPAGGIDFWLVSAKGGTPRKVYTSPNVVMVTSDGTRVLASKSKRLVVVDIASGEERPLTTGTGEEHRPLVSPDGRLVAFAANPEGKWAFYVAPLDRGLPVKAPLKIAEIKEPGVWVGSGGYGPAWWTRDGLLTYGMRYSESNLYRLEMDPKTGRAVDAPVRLTQDATRNWHPAVSPDGKRIAYWYEQGTKLGIAVMDSDGANERPLFEQNAVLPLCWRSPEEILFYHWKPKEGEKSSIQALNINTGVLQPVAQVEGLYWHYVPSRKEILHLPPGGAGPRPGAVLKAYSLAEGKDRVVAKIDYLMHIFRVSPDGKRIAYATSRPVEGSTQRVGEMGLMTIEGQPEAILVPAQSEAVVPTSWSPDGRYLLYVDQTGPRVMNVETRENWLLHKDLKDANWGRPPYWSPDGTFVVLTRSSTSSIERVAWEGVTTEAVMKLLEGGR